MPFTDLAPPNSGVQVGSGVSFGLSVSKSGKATCRLTMRAAAQEKLFGKSVIGAKCMLQVGRGADEGLLRLVLCDDGDFLFARSMRGSASVKIKAWDLLPKDKRPAQQIEVKTMPSNIEVIFRLPKWCRPSGVGGKMEAEFGLKRHATVTDR